MFINQKGVSIMLAVFMLSFILAIALGVNVILIRQVKVMERIGYSVIAFYAADSGVEQVLLSTPPVNIPETPLDGASYTVSVNASSSPDCDAENYCITSRGSYRNIRRAVEIIY